MQPSSLTFIEDALSALRQALHEKGSDLRNIQLATVGSDGSPEVRTLVLRGFDWPPALAEMHTDIRAGKAQALAGTRQVALLAWSAAEQLQLRFAGTAELHHDDAVARERWDGLSPNARNTYGTTTAPGSVIPDPEERTYLPPDEQYRQFGVLLIRLQSVDVLRLGPDGRQTRARGRFDGSAIESDWVTA